MKTNYFVGFSAQCRCTQASGGTTGRANIGLCPASKVDYRLSSLDTTSRII